MPWVIASGWPGDEAYSVGLRKQPVNCVYGIPWYTALGLCGVSVVYLDGVSACGFLWILSVGFVVSVARRW